MKWRKYRISSRAQQEVPLENHRKAEIAGLEIENARLLVRITELEALLAGPHARDEQLLWLAQIVESSEDAIIGKTLEGIVQSWNPASETLYGYSRAEMLGQSMTRLLPRDRPTEESKILRRLAQGERMQHFETVRVRKNGFERSRFAKHFTGSRQFRKNLWRLSHRPRHHRAQTTG